jgi:hypothetical protein
LPISRRFFCDGHLLEAQSTVTPIVTPIVTQKEAYLSGFLGNMTVVTLVTVDCAYFLRAGVAARAVLKSPAFSARTRMSRA